MKEEYRRKVLAYLAGLNGELDEDTKAMIAEITKKVESFGEDLKCKKCQELRLVREVS